MPNEQKKGEVTKVKFPVVVRSGQCPVCGQDLNEYIEAAEREKIELPTCCPNCGQPFVADNIKKRNWRCLRCNEIVLQPGTQRFCTNCQCELVYPDEPGYQELLEKIKSESP